MDDDRDNTGKGLAIVLLYAVIDLALWAVLIFLRATGQIRMNWPATILSVLWLALIIIPAGIAIWAFGWAVIMAYRKCREQLRRRKIAKTLQQAMEGLTLNSIGPIYGVKRKPKEKNREYKRRILKAARTLDVVNVGNAPEAVKPAAGEELDRIAAKYGLKRQQDEPDHSLRYRIQKKAKGEPEK